MLSAEGCVSVIDKPQPQRTTHGTHGVLISGLSCHVSYSGPNSRSAAVASCGSEQPRVCTSGGSGGGGLCAAEHGSLAAGGGWGCKVGQPSGLGREVSKG